MCTGIETRDSTSGRQGSFEGFGRQGSFEGFGIRNLIMVVR